MVLLSPLANALSAIKNAEKLGKKEIVIAPTSKLIENITKLFQKEGYLGEIQKFPNNRGGYLVVQLVGRINTCGIIKPHYAVKAKEIEQWEKQYLPSRNFGVLVISTSQGLMTHREAKKRGIGGRLIAYVY